MELSKLELEKLQLQKDELLLKKQQYRSSKFTSAHATVLAALITFGGSLYITSKKASNDDQQVMQQLISPDKHSVNESTTTQPEEPKAQPPVNAAGNEVYICIGSSKVYHQSADCYHLRACKKSVLIPVAEAVAMARRLCRDE